MPAVGAGGRCGLCGGGREGPLPGSSPRLSAVVALAVGAAGCRDFAGRVAPLAPLVVGGSFRGHELFACPPGREGPSLSLAPLVVGGSFRGDELFACRPGRDASWPASRVVVGGARVRWPLGGG